VPVGLLLPLAAICAVFPACAEESATCVEGGGAQDWLREGEWLLAGIQRELQQAAVSTAADLLMQAVLARPAKSASAVMAVPAAAAGAAAAP